MTNLWRASIKYKKVDLDGMSSGAEVVIQDGDNGPELL